MTNEELLARIDGLVSEGDAVPHRPSGEQFMTNTDRIERGPFSEWQSQTLSFLMSTFPSNHTYVRRFVDLTSPSDGVSGPMGEHRDAGLGILRAVREDVVAGYLGSLRDLISAEVFSDFLDMADHLLTEGYHHAAASPAGAVLEDGLRRALIGGGAKATGNLESMNQIAYGPEALRANGVQAGQGVDRHSQ